MRPEAPTPWRTSHGPANGRPSRRPRMGGPPPGPSPARPPRPGPPPAGLKREAAGPRRTARRLRPLPVPQDGDRAAPLRRLRPQARSGKAPQAPFPTAPGLHWHLLPRLLSPATPFRCAEGDVFNGYSARLFPGPVPVGLRDAGRRSRPRRPKPSRGPWPGNAATPRVPTTPWRTPPRPPRFSDRPRGRYRRWPRLRGRKLASLQRFKHLPDPDCQRHRCAANRHEDRTELCHCTV